MKKFSIKQFSKSEPGFTLLEILIAVSVMTTLLGAVVYFGFDITGFNNFITENIISQNELQLTLNAMVTELRSMNPSNIGSYPIEVANLNSLTFYSDADQDGLFERIRYYFSGNMLMRGIIKPSGSPLTYNPTNEKTTEAVHFVTSDPMTAFTYFVKGSTNGDVPMTAPIDVALVRSIKIQLTADRDINAEPGPVSFSVLATIRNLRNTQ